MITDMKRFLALPLMLLIMVSCAPQSYMMRLETRQKSDSGLDLDDKSMAIVYLEDGSVRDSLFNNCFADGLAQGLETEYFSGKRSVEIYSVMKEGDGNYLCRDSILNLVMSLDKDVVFVVDSPVIADSDTDKAACSTTVYAYDSMDKSDQVKVIRENGAVTTSVAEGSMMGSDAQYLGLKTSKQLRNSWVTESLPVIYFDDLDFRWIEAVLLAEEMKWEEAREIWMDLATEKNTMRSSCAQYNVALACYLMREYDLALEWLDLSDRNQVVDLSKDLRTRILQKKGK